MNKAFEKILEMLDVLIKKSYYEAIEGSHNAGIRNSAYRRVKKIVQEVAEEYKGGWIACSERLPEEYTVLCCDKYGEMIVGHPYFDEVSDTNYSAESDNEMMYNCVAWQPLPEPYKERD